VATPGNAGQQQRRKLTPEQWKEVDRLFHAALEVEEAERPQWLDSACNGDARLRTEVLSLLGSDEAAAARGGSIFVAGQFGTVAASLLQSDSPSRVGPYRLVRELGQGGMGTVYLAERDDDQYKTQVAIKLVRRGFDTDLILNRFYRERQTLARLQHPNIARLLDGGTTGEGLPYIVMEFIEGLRITDYCREKNLTIPQRLALFLNVCRAVDYAHRQFVVHRDLKPGNILVDQSGEVKLLDFGICKLLHTQTHFSSPDETIDAGLPKMLTPDYASPEQIRGDPITVASDVYSAAAVLYEILTGTKPHKIDAFTLTGIERGICETEVTKPSLAAAADKSLARQLRGDLDIILMHALEKDPARRYSTIQQFAEDIRLHLAHKPVHARPDQFLYRASKFIRRRRGLVAAAAAVLIAGSAGVVSTLRSARIANENLRLVRNLSNTFVFDVYDAVSSLPGSTNARQLIVKTGLQYLDDLSRNAGGDVELQRELASAYRRIGDVQGNVMSSNLGNTAEALRSYDKSLALLEYAVRRDPGNRLAVLEQITVYERIGAVRSYTRNPAQALASYETARNLAEAYFAKNPNDWQVGRRLAELHNATGEALRRGGDYVAARGAYGRALEILTRYEQSGAGSSDLELERGLSEAFAGRAMSDSRTGRLQEAVAGHRNAIDCMEKLLAKDPNNANYQRELMFKYSHLGDVLGNPNLSNVGDMPGAIAAYRKMSEVARRLYDADPADQRAIGDYGISLARTGAVLPLSDGKARVEVFSRSIELMQQVARKDPNNLAIKVEISAVHTFLGDAHRSLNQIDTAMQVYREGLAIAEPHLPSGSTTVATAYVALCRNLGELHAARGNRERAMEYTRKVLALEDPRNAATAKWSASLRSAIKPRIHGAVAMTYVAAADRAEARKWLQKSIESYRELQRKSSPNEGRQREMRNLEKVLETLQ